MNLFRTILVVLALSLTSCGSYIDSLNAYRNTPAGQEQLRRQFVLDSIRAANTPYYFRYDFGYYNRNNVLPSYYRHLYAPRYNRSFNRTRITVPRKPRVRRTPPPRQRVNTPRQRTRTRTYTPAPRRFKSKGDQ